MDDLDAAVALVYAQPPSGFVAARGALVKELKAAKRKEDAARVAGLRRPTKQAWAIGEAVRRSPEAAEAFFAAVDGLAEPGADLRRRTADLRAATAGLVGSVEGVEPGDATAALLATAADPQAIEALRLGRLADVPAGGGFGGLSLPAAPAGGAQPEPGRVAGREGGSPTAGGEAGATGDDGAEAEWAAEQERQEAEARARARAEQVAARQAEHERAVAAERAAAERAEAARAALERAQAELADATAALADARQAAATAADLLDTAERS